MSLSNRFPASYAVLAAVAGAVAWSCPFLVKLFVPRFPPYLAPPYRINLVELAIAYAVAAALGAGLFLVGLRLLPARAGRSARPVLSPAVVLASLAAAAIGGAFAGLFGYGLGFSLRFRSLLLSFGAASKVLDWGPEPLLSLGIIIGTGLGVAIVMGVLLRRMLPDRRSIHLIGEGVLRASAMALLSRLLIYQVEFSSIVTYSSFGKSPAFFLSLLAFGGALFGALAWSTCARLQPAQRTEPEQAGAHSPTAPR